MLLRSGGLLRGLPTAVPIAPSAFAVATTALPIAAGLALLLRSCGLLRSLLAATVPVATASFTPATFTTIATVSAGLLLLLRGSLRGLALLLSRRWGRPAALALL
ncbi:MAG: hypothetical protein ABL912_12085, partial [Novosphingobium sp.]